MTAYRDRKEAGEYEAPASPSSLDEMTKDELVEEASRRGIDVSSSWSKADVRAALD